MNKPFQIAIDGPSASGKSSTARQVAIRLGFTYIDSGAMYRAITLKAMENNLTPLLPTTPLTPTQTTDIINLAHKTPITLQTTRESTKVFIDKPPRDITTEIRTNPLVTKYVSPIASIPEIRKEVQKKQQEMANSTSTNSSKGVVMDGRDTGTVVFPNAQLKIFLTCPAEIRAKRRLLELGGEEALKDSERLRIMVQELVERDEADYNRKHGPLRKADDAVEIDTGDMTLEGQIELILKLAKERGLSL